MAGIGAESVVPLQTNAGGLLAQAVQPITPAVTPNSVSLLADAFRKGQISADDIIERYGNLAKTKEKAQIQNLDEFLHPEAIATRKQALDLMGEKQKSELATLPAETAAKQATLEATKIAAQQGDRKAIRDVAIAHGFGGQLSQHAPGTGNYTDSDAAKDSAAYANAVKYAAAVKGASDIEKDITRELHEETDEKGQVTRDPSKDLLRSNTSAINYTQEQAAKAHRLAMMTPEQFIAAGSPTVDQYVFGVEPKGTGESSAPGAVSVKDLVTPRKTIKTTTTSPDGTVTTKEETVEPTEHPNPDAASVTPGKPALDVTGGAYVKKAAPDKSAEKPAMIEEKAKVAGRIRTADDALASFDRAEKLIHNEDLKLVGPGAGEGTAPRRIKNRLTAFFGSDAGRAVTEGQSQLTHFLSQNVQRTIKSLAGTGNRVMQAEINSNPEDPGLFVRSQPNLTDTPETWDIWLNSLRDLIQKAKQDDLNLLPDEDRKQFERAPFASEPPAIKTAPRGAAVTEVSPGKKLVFDPATGQYHYVK